MRLLAFLTEPASVKPILMHLGLPIDPPRLAPARRPPLDDLDHTPTFDLTDPAPVPQYEFDQTVSSVGLDAGARPTAGHRRLETGPQAPWATVGGRISPLDPHAATWIGPHFTGYRKHRTLSPPPTPHRQGG